MVMDTGAGMPGAVDEAIADAVVTFFQPFYNLHTDALQGLEALARRDTTGSSGADGLPAGLFAEARERGQARELDLTVLEAAIGHFAAIQAALGDAAGSRLIVRVNACRDTIAHPYLVADVTAALRRHEISGDRLLVDIPTVLFRDLVDERDAATLDRLRHLQAMEISFCLDGFTDADLDLLPAAGEVGVDIITLHPRVLAGEADALARLARAVQDVGLPVVAAGVETSEQLALVRDLGFEWAQGFLLGEPSPAGDTLDHPMTLPDA